MRNAKVDPEGLWRMEFTGLRLRIEKMCRVGVFHMTRPVVFSISLPTI